MYVRKFFNVELLSILFYMLVSKKKIGFIRGSVELWI